MFIKKYTQKSRTTEVFFIVGTGLLSIDALGFFYEVLDTRLLEFFYEIVIKNRRKNGKLW